MATREDIRVGDLIRLWGRQFVVLSIGDTGVWTRRVPLDPPMRGEPRGGEEGFIEWLDLRGAPVVGGALDDRKTRADIYEILALTGVSPNLAREACEPLVAYVERRVQMAAQDEARRPVEQGTDTVASLKESVERLDRAVIQFARRITALESDAATAKHVKESFGGKQAPPTVGDIRRELAEIRGEDGAAVEAATCAAARPPSAFDTELEQHRKLTAARIARYNRRAQNTPNIDINYDIDILKTLEFLLAVAHQP